MVVTCPNCRSRYAVDPLKIGPAGRTVECARCHHQWHQKVEGLTPAPEVVIRPPTTGASLPAVIPPKPALPWRRITAIALFVALLIVLFAFRGKIATMISYEARASQPLQAAIAAPVSPATLSAANEPAAHTRATSDARPQIEIDLPNSTIDAVDGHFVVRGQLVNNGRAPGSTTLLRLTFKRNEEVLGERSFPLVEGPLPPGGRTTFSQVLENPPSGTTDIVPAVE